MTQAELLIDLASTFGVQLFHGTDLEPFASIPVDKHREIYPIRSKSFKRWALRNYFNTEAKAPGSQALEDALRVLEAKALFDSPEDRVFTRLAEHDGRYYLDLANPAWQVVEITSQKWTVLDKSPVPFRRVSGMEALPLPVPGGTEDLKKLQSMINVSPDDWPLIEGFIIGALNPRSPFVVLLLHGEQGSAKSTTMRMVRSLIDPNTCPIRAEPRDEQDLMIAATNSWVLALDNLSRMPDWLSDAICRLATGAGWSTRTLYTTAEETLFTAARPVMINAIEELSVRGDLLDRSIVLYAPPIPDNNRLDEHTLWADFEAARPSILGALLDIVVTGIRNLPTVRLEQMPRMADYARWLQATQPAALNGTTTMLEAYKANRTSAHELVLEASPIVPYLKELALPLTGTAGELLEALNAKAPDDVRKSRSWPGSPRTLSNHLRRLTPTLRAVKIGVNFSRGSGSRSRLITLEKADIAPTLATLPSQTYTGPCVDSIDSVDSASHRALGGRIQSVDSVDSVDGLRDLSTQGESSPDELTRLDRLDAEAPESEDDASLLDDAAFVSLAEYQPVFSGRGDSQLRNWRDELAPDDDDIESSWAQEADAAEDPLVALVLKTYPGSRVIGVRPAAEASLLDDIAFALWRA